MNRNPDNSDPKPKRKGSVQRARTMLEAGQRPQIPTPSPSESSAKSSHKWPLLGENHAKGLLDPHSHAPRGPPPHRPPRPDAPSPSIYSERSGSKQHVPSFSQPLPRQSRASSRASVRDSSPASRASTVSSTPNISITNKDQRSSISNTASAPNTQNVIPSNQRTAGLAPPPQCLPRSSALRQVFSRRSSVSPICEESSQSSANLDDSYASSKAVPSWGSAPPESENLSYFDNHSSSDLDDQELRQLTATGEGLVRQASVGTKSKPSLRVFHKRSSKSENQPLVAGNDAAAPILPGTAMSDNGQNEALRIPSPNGSFASLSDCSYEFDLEKGAFVLDIGQNPGQHDPGNSGLPRSMPSMSEKRPGARRPPRLDMNAVRDAEARGSLTSLSDLIRRAARLASNLDYGRTASRTDVLNDVSRAPWDNRRRSSMHNALASFPPPPRASWPIFMRRSTLHNIDTIASDPEHVPGCSRGHPFSTASSRRCCGMPLWLFITLLIILIIAVTLAVLLPVFLIVVPKENSAAQSACEKSTPCHNGGISVSSGNLCSCVCTNGYSGAQCTIPEDGSCTTSTVGNGKWSATMGSELTEAFDNSQNMFNIPLDPTTIMALFSRNDASCSKQNELIDVGGGNKNNAKRFWPVLQDEGMLAVERGGGGSGASSTTTTTDLEITHTLAERDTMAMENGIVYDNSEPSSDGKGDNKADNARLATDSSTTARSTSDTATATNAPGTETETDKPSTTAASENTATPTHHTSSSSSSATSTTTPTSAHTVPKKDFSFARTAILYILQVTGSFDAAIHSSTDLRHYLSTTYSTSQSGSSPDAGGSSGKDGAGDEKGDGGAGGQGTRYVVNLPQGNFALDFNAFSITVGNGTKVGG